MTSIPVVVVFEERLETTESNELEEERLDSQVHSYKQFHKGVKWQDKRAAPTLVASRWTFVGALATPNRPSQNSFARKRTRES